MSFYATSYKTWTLQFWLMHLNTVVHSSYVKTNVTMDGLDYIVLLIIMTQWRFYNATSLGKEGRTMEKPRKFAALTN